LTSEKNKLANLTYELLAQYLEKYKKVIFFNKLNRNFHKTAN